MCYFAQTMLLWYTFSIQGPLDPLHNAALAPFDASGSQPNTFPVSIIKLLTLFHVSVGRNFANWL